MLGSQLPVAGISTVEGKIIRISYGSDPRRGTFATPSFEFETDGKMFRATALRGYSIRDLPFGDEQKVPVVFATDDPTRAWLKWEYDNLLTEYNSFSARAYDAIEPVYNYLAGAVVVAVGAFLFVNLFTPLLGLAKRD